MREAIQVCESLGVLGIDLNNTLDVLAAGGLNRYVLACLERRVNYADGFEFDSRRRGVPPACWRAPQPLPGRASVPCTGPPEAEAGRLRRALHNMRLDEGPDTGPLPILNENKIPQDLLIICGPFDLVE